MDRYSFNGRSESLGNTGRFGLFGTCGWRILGGLRESMATAPLGVFVPKDAGVHWSGDMNGWTEYEAEDYCQKRNQRLPTARELANYAQNQGADGISESKKQGYQLVSGSDSVGNPDHFYYSNRGYKRPAGDLGNFRIWSSSAVPPYITDGGYYLNGIDGSIDSDYRGRFFYKYVNGSIEVDMHDDYVGGMAICIQSR
jgi:hypothetical protein